MNRSRSCLASLVALACAGTLALAAAGATQARPHYGFDKLKGLVGSWTGRNKEGKPVKAIYTLVADGSALMETLDPGDESTMITVYHPDGSRLMMTHYCSAHNQPRMRAEAAAADPKTLTFHFVDATNLASPSDPHMERLVVGFVDPDHFTQEWTFRTKEQKMVDVFTFQRQ